MPGNLFGEIKTPPFLTGFLLSIRFKYRSKVRIRLDVDASEHNQLRSYA